MRRILHLLIFLAATPVSTLPVGARDFTSSVTVGSELMRLRPDFKVPDEPNQLFYIQRSPNSNTVVYTARLEANGEFDSRAPVEGFWRKFNIDGSRQSLTFVERLMAY